MKKYVATTILLGLIFPVFLSAQTPQDTGLPNAEIPESIEEAVREGQEVGGQILEELPGVLTNLWDNRVIPVWTKMFDWAVEVLWGKYFFPFVKNIWQQITAFFEEKRPQLEEEFAKEKQEIKEGLKQGAAKVGQGLWQRFLDLFRDENVEN